MTQPQQQSSTVNFSPALLRDIKAEATAIFMLCDLCGIDFSKACSLMASLRPVAARVGASR